MATRTQCDRCEEFVAPDKQSFSTTVITDCPRYEGHHWADTGNDRGYFGYDTVKVEMVDLCYRCVKELAECYVRIGEGN